MVVALDGFQALDAALQALTHKGKVAARALSQEVARETARRHRSLLAVRWHPPRMLTNSPPGQPPAMVTGRLRESVKVTPPVPSGGWWITRTGPTTKYGRIQELGGVCGWQHRTRLPPRPSLEPAWRLTRMRIGSIVQDVWRRG